MAKNRERRLPELTTRAKVLLAVGVVVAIAAIATLIITSSIARQLKGSDTSVQEDFSSKDTATRKQDAMQSSSSALQNGNTDKANAIYEKALAAESDPVKKVDLAVDQSKLLYYAGNYDQALDAAKKAEAYNDDKYLISDWLARLYSLGGHYTEAATYYAKAGALIDSPQNTGHYTKKYYDNKVASMKALAAKK